MYACSLTTHRAPSSPPIERPGGRGRSDALSLESTAAAWGTGRHRGCDGARWRSREPSRGRLKGRQDGRLSSPVEFESGVPGRCKRGAQGSHVEICGSNLKRPLRTTQWPELSTASDCVTATKQKRWGDVSPYGSNNGKQRPLDQPACLNAHDDTLGGACDSLDLHREQQGRKIRYTH